MFTHVCSFCVESTLSLKLVLHLIQCCRMLAELQQCSKQLGTSAAILKTVSFGICSFAQSLSSDDTIISNIFSSLPLRIAVGNCCLELFLSTVGYEGRWENISGKS